MKPKNLIRSGKENITSEILTCQKKAPLAKKNRWVPAALLAAFLCALLLPALSLAQDSDGDGLTDTIEDSYCTGSTVADTDGDGLCDGNTSVYDGSTLLCSAGEDMDLTE